MKNKDISAMLVIVVVSTIMILGFHALRFSNINTLHDYEQYETIELSKSHLSSLNNLVPVAPGLVYRIIPLLLSFINIILIYLATKKITNNCLHSTLTSLVFSLSPINLYLHTTYNQITFPLTLLLLGITFLLYNKLFFGFIFLLSTIFINQNLIIIVILCLILFFDRSITKNSISLFIGMILSIYIFVIFNNSIKPDFSFYVFLTDYVADFGASIGFGIFGLILGMLGIIFSWPKKKNIYLFYVSIISLFIITLIDKRFLVFCELLLIYFGGFALFSIIKTKWNSDELKHYILTIILCGLIFSSGSYIKRMSEIGPVKSEIDSLEWLEFQNPKGIVLSSFEYGDFIHSVSGFEVLLNNKYHRTSKDQIKIYESENIFQSRTLSEIVSFFEKEEISYIWINQNMKNGQVWSNSEQGILLVLKNSKYFSRIYDHKNVEIWTFKNPNIYE